MIVLHGIDHAARIMTEAGFVLLYSIRGFACVKPEDLRKGDPAV